MDPTPSSLIAIWPGDEPPTPRIVAERLPGLVRLEGPPPFEVPDALWFEAYSFGSDQGASAMRAPLLFWAAGIEHLPASAELDPQPLGEGGRAALRAARFILGLVEVLDVHEPLSAWQQQLRRLLAVAPSTPCVVDDSATALWSPEKARAMAQATVPPHPACLYRVHVVLPDRPGIGTWVHTHGLQRAGFPDVEVLGVPGHLGSVAALLIEQFVSVFLGQALPARSQPFEFLLGYHLSWLPWREAVRQQAALGMSGDAERRELGDHGGFRIVLVDPLERGVRTPWREAPLALMQALQSEDLLVRLSPDETHRRQHMAEERWPALVHLFRRHRRQGDWEFLVQLAYPIEEVHGPGREHLWFQVLEIEEGRVRGRLVNSPRFVERLREGRAKWHPLKFLVDWEIHAPGRTIRPETVQEP